MLSYRLWAGVLLLCLLPGHHLWAQSGCTDPLALNYDPQATLNDGTCAYPPTVWTPARQAVFDARLDESSGLAFFHGRFWTFNDSGGAPEIYAVDTASGAVTATFRLLGATNVDWEAMAVDSPYVYIADVGNNVNGARRDLVIYRIPLYAISPDQNGSLLITAQNRIHFSYSSQTDTTALPANTTAFDCEAMVATGDTLHLFSKNWATGNSTVHFTLPAQPGQQVAHPQDTFPSTFLVTDASLRTGAHPVLTLVGYDPVSLGATWLWLFYGFEGNRFFSANKRLISLGSALTLGQVEGVHLGADDELLLTNERFSAGGFITIPQGSWRRSVAGFVPAGNVGIRQEVLSGAFAWRFSPDEGIFEVQNTSKKPLELDLTLQDLSGRQVFRQGMSLRPGEQQIRQVHGLSSGVYVVNFRENGRQIAALVVVPH
jgi:hypothetical protein